MLYKIRKNKSIVDIILLTYNNIFNTKKCIDHLYRYTPDFSLTILDNNSAMDSTCEYLKKIANENDNITLFFNDNNSGIIEGRNFAYSLSKDTEYIFFIDNDQFVSDGWLQSYLSFIEKGYDIVGAEGWKMKDDFYPHKKITDSKDSFSYVGAGGMFLKRETMEDVGLFDEIFSPIYFEDPDFNFRAIDKDYKICWNTENKICHKPHSLLGKGDRVFYFRRNLYRFREKWKGKKVPVLKIDL